MDKDSFSNACIKSGVVMKFTWRSGSPEGIFQGGELVRKVLRLLLGMLDTRKILQGYF